MLPGFEESTGIKVVTSSGASEGNWPKTIRCQLAHGATADVAILSREGLNILNEDGQIKQHSDAGLATTPLAAAVRPSTAKTDIATDTSFRSALIDAELIAMPGSTSGIFIRDKVFPKLNLPKNVTFTLVARGTESAENFRRGKSNLAICPSSELTNLPGIEMAGLLRKDLHLVQTFTARL
jgi:molybdate transport system substrate-binding protein